MLRTLVALLLLANALFFAWAQGWLAPVLGGPDSNREPQRLQLALHPERLTLLTPQAASALQQPACLELGPFADEAGLRGAQAALERLGLTAAAWQVESGEQAGQWAVATIKLDSKDQLARKEEAYKRLHLDFEPLTSLPAEQPALLLSRHASEAAARTALEQLQRRPLRDLRLLQLQAPQPRHVLRLPTANSLLARQIADSRDKALGAPHACSASVAPPAAAPAASSIVNTAMAAASAAALPASSAGSR